MSNNKEWYEDDDDFDTENNDQDGGLKNLRNADRAKAKRIKELETELESLRKFQKETVVSSVLKEKGVNPKIAALIPAEVTSDPEAVSKWLEDFGDIFGAPQAQKPVTEEQQIDRNLAALRQIDFVANSSISPDGVNDVYSRINNAGSAEEIIELINGF